MKAQSTPEDDQFRVSRLIARLDKVSSVLYEKNKREAWGQAILYAAFLSDLNDGRIANDARVDDILSDIESFCSIVKNNFTL